MSAQSILVIGSDTRAFLGVIRSFGRHGTAVDVVPFDDFDPARCSRFIRDTHAIGFPQAHQAEWISQLTDVIVNQRYDLVVPVDDRSILPIDENRDRFAKHTTLAIPGTTQIRTVNSKEAMRNLACAHGVPVCDGWLANGPEQIRSFVREIGFPVVLKPISSYSKEALTGKRYVRKAFAEEELDTLLAREFSEGSAIVERNFIGFGVGVKVLCKDGRVLTAMQHHRVHEPLHGGGSSYRVSVPISPDLLEASKKLMAAVDYTGVAMIEFKRNPASGEAIFIEVNGRFAGSLPLCLAAGFDLPWWYGEMLLDGRTAFPAKFKVGRYSRAISADANWLIANLRADKKDPTLATMPVLQTLVEPLRLLVGAERLDALAMDDPAPGLEELRQFFRKKLLSWRYKKPSHTKPPQLPQGSRVLVVCKGNICRSPFAAAVLKRRRPDLQIDLAGYYPVYGRPTPEAGILAAKRFGIDLTEHRSKKLDRDLLETQDVILLFDRQNRVTLGVHFPDIESEVATFGEAYIEDPYGGSVERFESCYREIEDAAARFDLHGP